jgi:hypothetical protein
MGDDRTASDDAMVPDAHSRHHDRLRADKAESPNVGVRVEETRHVVRQDDGVEGNIGTVPDVNTARIGEVQASPQRDENVLANVHSQQMAVESYLHAD